MLLSLLGRRYRVYQYIEMCDLHAQTVGLRTQAQRGRKRQSDGQNVAQAHVGMLWSRAASRQKAGLCGEHTLLSCGGPKTYHQWHANDYGGSCSRDTAGIYNATVVIVISSVWTRELEDVARHGLCQEGRCKRFIMNLYSNPRQYSDHISRNLAVSIEGEQLRIFARREFDW